MLFWALLLPHLCWAEQSVLKSQSNNIANKSPLDAAFADFVNETLHYYHIPGLSISVVKGDEIYAEVSTYHFILLVVLHNIRFTTVT